jgi:hypothetical protein
LQFNECFFPSIDLLCLVYPNALFGSPVLRVKTKNLKNFSLSYDLLGEHSVEFATSDPVFVYIEQRKLPLPEFITVQDAGSQENFNKLIGIAVDGVPMYSGLSNMGHDVFDPGTIMTHFP